MRAKEYTPREFVALLKRNGYEYDRSKGDHKMYRNKEGNTIAVTTTKLNRMVAARLIKENNLKED